MKRIRKALVVCLVPLFACGASLRGDPNSDDDRGQSLPQKNVPSSQRSLLGDHGGVNIFRDAPQRRRKPHDYKSSSQSSSETPRTAGKPQSDFMTLQCNSKLSSAPCTTKWTSLFKRQFVYQQTIIIPCGQCVTMDLSYPEVTLEKGLDIQGKLVIPDGYKVTVTTPFVLVQGELHINSTVIPDGIPVVRFISTGTDEQVTMFRPADSNSEICGGNHCNVGKKPFVVAGGRVHIEALQPDTPSWVKLYDMVDQNKVVLPSLIRQRWGVGAEVLVTSHTLSYKDQQVRRIAGFSDYASDSSNYVVVELDQGIRRPTTIKNDPDFAVEVALLARNVVFEGADDDPNYSHGAHFIVYHTPLIKQKLEGVEFRNYGQQGNLGRYPIHFHLCGDVSGSIVSKNLIRESNQRCIVIHGTDNLLVDSNVAFETSGHCFMTEDGNEQGNIFRSNLGALTVPVRVIIPDNGSNGEETDDKPSTFWMTNPSNIWEFNVAAGSAFSGYWLELRPKVRGPHASEYRDLNPMRAPLTLFKGNVAHSNRDKGMRTYPDGYIPDDEAIFLDSRFYRNEGDGFWLHHTHNVIVDGGIYADNRRQVDFDRAEKLTFKNARIVGISEDYHSIMDSQSVPGICSTKKALAGIQFHSFTRDMSHNGAILDNITLSGFVNTGCSSVAAFDFDNQVERGSFDFFTTLSNITIEDGAIPINFCEAKSVGIEDIFITDLDSSARPSTSTFTGTSSIVSDNPIMTRFLRDCTPVSEQCYAYCENACLRTVTYAVDPAGTADLRLQVCDTSQPSTCIELSDTFFYDEKSSDLDTVMFNTNYKTRRYYAATLPQGSYAARFVDSTGVDAWPTFAQEIYEDKLCSNSIVEGSVHLSAPRIHVGECSNLIRNGDAEESSDQHSHWLHRKGGIDVVAGMGIGGSNAFIDLERKDKNKDGISQYLDSRCLSAMKGQQYEIKAWVKLMDGTKLHLCNANKEDCPEVDVRTYTGMDQDYKKTVAETVVSHSSNEGYQLVHGVLDMTSRFEAATSVMLTVRRNAENLIMYVDNVSVDLLQKYCGVYNLVRNGRFDDGDSRFWENKKRTLEIVQLDGNYAAKSRDGELSQYITTGCMNVGEEYSASAWFQVVDQESSPLKCTDVGQCPVITLRPTGNGKSTTFVVAGTEETASGSWYKMSGVFAVDESLATAESIRLSFDEVPRGMNLIVDDVTVNKYVVT